MESALEKAQDLAEAQDLEQRFALDKTAKKLFRENRHTKYSRTHGSSMHFFHTADPRKPLGRIRKNLLSENLLNPEDLRKVNDKRCVRIGSKNFVLWSDLSDLVFRQYNAYAVFAASLFLPTAQPMQLSQQASIRTCTVHSTSSATPCEKHYRGQCPTSKKRTNCARSSKSSCGGIQLASAPEMRDLRTRIIYTRNCFVAANGSSDFCNVIKNNNLKGAFLDGVHVPGEDDATLTVLGL